MKKIYSVEVDDKGYRRYKKGDWTHRIDGPAVIYSSGVQKFFIDNEEYTEKEHQNFKELHHAYGYPRFIKVDGEEHTEEELAYLIAEHKALKGTLV